ncbi:MAG: SPOR domain-containing protein [Gemmatimonadetes bacterium]|nr:SPOR domain-containing protein [Gemmatimonadota bacterium]MYB67112.1 SPOR domain-containing protein [Gemmatimonadota bacterium]
MHVPLARPRRRGYRGNTPHSLCRAQGYTLSAANPNRLWMLAWTVLWIGGCAASDVREDEQAPESEPAGRSEIVILTPTDSMSTPADTIDASDASDASAASDAEDTSDASPVFFDPDGQFTIQVGVFRDANRADQQVRELKDAGYPAYSLQSDAGVRVRIGYFANRADAERFGRIFAKDRGVEYWVARRADE